jgi:hypothetical protein
VISGDVSGEQKNWWSWRLDPAIGSLARKQGQRWQYHVGGWKCLANRPPPIYTSNNDLRTPTGNHHNLLNLANQVNSSPKIPTEKIKFYEVWSLIHAD